VPGQVEGRAGILQRDLVDGVVGDVLAEPLLAVALDRDHGAQPFEAGGRELLAPQLVPLDLQRQVGEAVEAGHRR
jgi:hypothetical protein